MKEKVKELKTSLKNELSIVNSMVELAEVKAEFLGKKGKITELTQMMKELKPEEKKEFGKYLNEVKSYAEDEVSKKQKEIEARILEEKLEKERIDVTLPATKIKNGSPNMLEGMIEDLEELFLNMGYDVVEGPEVE